MAKRLLLNVLVKVLGEFIELNEENLNLAVWSGQIVLTNLRLKTDHILKNYNLNVFHGSVQRLEVTIPWASLLVSPVKIVIEGVLLDVGPLDIAKLGKIEALKRYMAEKLQKLKMVDQYLALSLNLKADGEKLDGASTNSKDPNSESYIQQWTTKIIDNIEIKVTNLHVRYEDRLSIPGRVFACGVTLSSFGLSASDKNWNIGATKQANTSADGRTVYKLAYLTCLVIYWQVDAASLATMPLKEWERIMMLYIVKEDWTLPGESSSGNYSTPGGGSQKLGAEDVSRRMPSRDYSRELVAQQSNAETREYVLSPYKNSLTLKLTQSKKPSATVPKFNVRAESSNLQLHFDSVQYVELFSVVDRISALGRMFKPRTYRPNERPYNRRSSIAWWKYACKLAVRSRRYTDLVKLSLRLADGREDPHQYLPPYAAAEVRYLEERLPFEPLRVGRQRALLELYEEERQLRKMQEPQPELQRSGSTWWGGWTNSPAKPSGKLQLTFCYRC
jgi:vacuolar protein sorting-associated protein 13A/C